MEEELKLSPLLLSAGRGICASCLAAATGIAQEKIPTLIDNIRPNAPVRDAHDNCIRCGHHMQLFAIDYPLP